MKENGKHTKTTDKIINGIKTLVKQMKTKKNTKIAKSTNDRN